MRITEVAERSGLPTTTIRYYERIGLVRPAGRTGNGYRAYTDDDVARLRFVAAARHLDLPLADIRSLVAAWDGQECTSVGHEVRESAGRRAAELRERGSELLRIADSLDGLAADAAATHSGPCGAGCPCETALAGTREQRALACRLGPDEEQRRIGDWNAVLASATTRAPVHGGMRVTFPVRQDLAADLARLAVAERACCPFLNLTITVTGEDLRLDATGPDGTWDLIASALGAGEDDC